MVDFFKDYNPWSQGLFFITILGFTMVFRHPLVQGASFLAALCYLFIQAGPRKGFKILGLAMATGVFITILNPILVHQGATILWYFPNGNPLTLESILYGLSAGLMFTTVLLWFSCHNRVMTSDRILYLTGRVLPSLSLIFSMVLRFVPLYKDRIATIYACRKGIGEDLSQGSLLTRFKNALKIFSIFVTWSLEASIETADSMKARGHGLEGRTHFALFKVDLRDYLVLGYLILAGLVCLVAAYYRKFKLVIYPTVKIAKVDGLALLAFALFVGLAFMPIIVTLVEEWRWKYLK